GIRDFHVTGVQTCALPILVVDLDRNYTIASVAVDGQALPASAWSNPEGRMTVTLPATLAAGEAVKLRIVYGGKPHVAKRAPWDRSEERRVGKESEYRRSPR